MIVPFLRSSLINTYDLCQGRSIIEYGVGRRGEAGKAALIGSCVHGVLEIAALYKLAQQKDPENISFVHDSFGSWGGEFSSRVALNVVYNYYNKESPDLFTEDSYSECEKLLEKAFSFEDGSFDPANQNIIAAEYAFDIPMKRDWAKYSYTEPNGTVVNDYLSLKGTVDLITQVNDHTICCTDYKTGKTANDWATGKTKTSEMVVEGVVIEDNDKTTSLYKDAQLQLYYYALAHDFFDKDIIINLYFVRLNKLFTIIFERTDLPKIEKFLQSKYEEMVQTTQPTWLVDTKNRWKCKWCPHYTNREAGTNQTVCWHFKNAIARKGYDKVMADKADWKSISSYGAGGSSKSRE